MKPAAPVMTILRRFMISRGGPSPRSTPLACGAPSPRAARGSQRLALENAAEERHPHDFQVERDGPVLDVVQVELDPFFERRVAAPSVYLSPAGNAGLHLVAQHVLREPMLELVDEERPLGPRADNRHITPQHVDRKS